MKRLTIFLALLTACATVPRGTPGYDGETEIVETTASDSVMFVPVRIENNRSRDIIAPRFYLDGFGRHSLGIVEQMHTVTKLVDVKWLRSDGCMRIVAHYVGVGDWTSNEFCWRRGETITVSLQPILSTSNAWSHR